MQWIRLGGLFLVLIIGLSPVMEAQFPTRPQTFGNPPAGFPTGPTGFTPSGGFLQQPDSAGTDSLSAPKVKPDARFVERDKLFTHQDFKPTITYSFDRVHYWDGIELAEGFVQSLGQIGKPHQIFYHGFPERFYDRPFWYNPVMGRYNRYMINPETQIPYLDTRTPFVNVNYSQAQQELQLTDVTVSQNISPFWNTVLYFQRRQDVGIYRNFVTDHYNLFASNYFHTKNDRYHLFFNGTFNELSDEIHGGTPRSRDSSRYFLDDGLVVIRDEIGAYNASFFKANRAPMLNQAQGKRIVKGVYADHYYHLFGVGDSAKGPHKLTLRNSNYWEYSYQRFFDNQISTSSLAANYIPVYPTLSDTNVISEAFATRRFKSSGEASYSLALKNGFQLNVNGGINYERMTFNRDSLNLHQNITEQLVAGTLTMPWVVISANIRQRFSNLFPAERYVKLKGDIYPIITQRAYRISKKGMEKDSLQKEIVPDVQVSKDSSTTGEKHKLLTLSLQYDIRHMNPSFFQRYYIGRGGNTFLPNTELVNQQFNHLTASVNYRPPTTILRGDTILGNYYTVEIYLSNAGRLVYYSDSLEVLQAETGEALTRIGAELRFRQRILWHLYLESNIGLQKSSTQGGEYLQMYARSIPQVYGRASIYFHRENLKIAKKLRIGVDIAYNTGYLGQTVDAATGEFFPTRYYVPAYPRADAYFVLHPPRSHTYVWFKYSHLNEWIPFRGYYTTPFYPMLARTFSLGVNWTFFD